MIKIKVKKREKLKNDKCPYCGNKVGIFTHKYENSPIRYYIRHLRPVKDIDGVDCILSASICFLDIKQLIERWDGAFE